MFNKVKSLTLGLCIALAASIPTTAQQLGSFRNYRDRIRVYPGAFIDDHNDPNDYDITALNSLFLPAGGSIAAECPNVADVNMRPLDQPHFVLDVEETTRVALTASALPFSETELVLFLIAQDGSFGRCTDRAETGYNIDTPPELAETLEPGRYGVWVAVEKFSPDQQPGFGLMLEILTSAN